MTKRIPFLLFMILALSLSGFGQTSVNQTILSAAVNNTTANQFSVASTTGAVANTTMAYIDNEASDITAVDSTNNIITVRRGTRGTVAGPHNNNTIVYIGVFAAFNVIDPVKPEAMNSPQCARTGTATFNTGLAGIGAVQVYTPWINIRNGNIWDCDANTLSWRLVNLVRGPGASAYHYVDDAAYTALLTDSFVDYRLMTAARTLTLPPVTGIFGKILTVKTENTSGRTLTVQGSNAQGVGTSTVGATATLTGNTVLRFISVGGSWVTW